MSSILEDKTPRRAGETLTILPSGVMIAVTPQGVMLPEGDGFPARTLDRNELEILEALGDVCLLGIGHTVESDIWGVWELTSSVSRPVVPLRVASSDLPPRHPAPLQSQAQPEAR